MNAIWQNSPVRLNLSSLHFSDELVLLSFVTWQISTLVFVVLFLLGVADLLLSVQNAHTSLMRRSRFVLLQAILNGFNGISHQMNLIEIFTLKHPGTVVGPWYGEIIIAVIDGIAWPRR